MKNIKFALVTIFVEFTIFSTFASSENSFNGKSILHPHLQMLGTVLKSQEGKDILAFQGIPYAKPPLGERRFNDPEPYGRWEGVLDATKEGYICPQVENDLNEIESLKISEDCLTLNVYTTSMQANKTVIVFIHGGGLRYGTGHSLLYPSNYILDEDIVLVTFNYRIGVLGFVTSGTKEAPGNYGLKDQVLVLRWVRDNIEHFGGNPNSVTLTGHSAGSMSTILHMVSPMSKNLFHRVVALSGAATNQWRLHNVNLTKTMSELVECPSDDSVKMIECLRQTPWEKFLEISAKWDENELPDMEWNVEIEKDFGQERFITDDPSVLFKKGEFHRVPIIAGVTKDEFAYRGRKIISKSDMLKYFNEDFNNLGPLIIGYDHSETNKSNYISNKLKELYFKNEVIGIQNERDLGDLISDAIINYGVHRLVELTSQYTDIYYFVLDYKGRYTCSISDDNDVPYYVHHADVLMYLFGFEVCVDEAPDKDADLVMLKKFTKYVINLSDFGNPNGNPNDDNDPVCTTKWIPSKKGYMKAFYIDEKCRMDEVPYKERYAVWDELFPVD